MHWEAIVAFDEKFGIGYRGRLPWGKNAADMEFFREKSQNKILLMGRATWESLPKKPLPGRKHIVLTTDKDFIPPEGVSVFGGVSEVLSFSETLQEYETILVCGGASVYFQFLPLIERFHTALIEGEYDSDVRLPIEVLSELTDRTIFTIEEMKTVPGAHFRTHQRINTSWANVSVTEGL